MIGTNYLNSITHNQKLNNKEIQLKPGQIFKGKIVKFFPNQMAQVQLGNMTVHARLEAALTAHQQYWFEVQSNKALLELKVIERDIQTGTKSNGDQQLLGNQLLKSIGLSESKTNQKLLQLLLDQKTPFSKAELQQAAQLIKEAGSLKTGLEAIQTLLEKNLPLTKSVFKSVESIYQNPSVSKQIQDALQILQNTKQTQPALTELKQFLQQYGNNQNDKNTQSMNFELGHLTDKEKIILQQIGQLNSSNLKNNMLTLLKQLLQVPEKTEQHQVILSILGKAGMIQEDSSLESIYQNIKRAIIQETGSSSGGARFSLPDLTLSPKEFILSTLQNIEKLNPEDRNLLARWFTSKVIEAGQRSRSEAPFIENTPFERQNNSSDLTSYVKRMIANLGLDYESNLSKTINNDQLVDRNNETLKALLIKALDENPPSSVRQSLEALLNRVTGQQLLSSEVNGAMQHLLVQVPIKFGKHLTDATIQWSGKRKKSGELDPDHCRIVFYLELNAIKETLIDVHVQNRIVNIRLFNETPGINKIVSMFTPVLKDSLTQNRYTLSSVKVIDSFAEKKEKQTNQRLSTNSYMSQPYTGVDFRV